MAKLAIIDWGIGGLGLYKLVKAHQPRLAIHYFSDAGAVPYGKQPRAMLQARLGRVFDHLADAGVTHIAVACNAASTVLPVPAAKRQPPVAAPPVVTGVIAPAIRALRRKSRTAQIAVVGGKRTVRSNTYRRNLPQHHVVQRAAQPISAFIERGELASAALDASLAHIMAPLANADVLVLACTHYPAIADQFARLAPRATLVDPALLTWQWMQHHWPVDQFATGADTVETTGPIGPMRKAAFAAFGIALPTIARCRL